VQHEADETPLENVTFGNEIAIYVRRVVLLDNTLLATRIQAEDISRISKWPFAQAVICELAHVSQQ